jgi:hypothetical protein
MGSRRQAWEKARRFYRALLQTQRDIAESTRQLAESYAAVQQQDIAAIAKELADIRQQLASIQTQTWHNKETLHAGLLTAVFGADGRYADTLRLPRYHAQVYSQNGEDGIIAEIFRRIGEQSRCFVEIGTGEGGQNNTRFLLEQGWRGVWIEADAAAAANAAQMFADAVKAGRLTVLNANVTSENVNQLLASADAPPSFDLLSVDIDFNTSHVWNALRCQSRVACIEYNASLPPTVDLAVPYDPDAVWDGSNWYGGSLKTLERIGAAKGLALVGCDLFGVNAFFVRHAEAQGRFREPFTAECHYELPRHNLLAHIGHSPSSCARVWRRDEATATSE